MISYGRQLTNRIPVDRSLWFALRCALKLHPMSRWERMTGTLTEKHGRTKTEREVFLQCRECIACGLAELKHL